VLGTFREICAVKADDGAVFDVDELTIDRIREGLEYGGLRMKTTATIGGSRVRIVVDIAFGDSIEPGAEDTELPVLLDLPAPRLRAYPRETVIAEKFQAMVMLGRANSRMKDFYDIWLLSRSYEFTGDGLARAIAATFVRRKTPIPTELPDALTRAFAADPAKVQQWSSFVDDVAVKPGDLASVIDDLAAFVTPHAAAALKLEGSSHAPHPV
jgi:hypothetical protein